MLSVFQDHFQLATKTNRCCYQHLLENVLVIPWRQKSHGRFHSWLGYYISPLQNPRHPQALISARWTQFRPSIFWETKTTSKKYTKAASSFLLILQAIVALQVKLPVPQMTGKKLRHQPKNRYTTYNNGSIICNSCNGLKPCKLPNMNIYIYINNVIIDPCKFPISSQKI